MVFDPFKNLGVLVSGIVVDDHMHRLLLGHLGINDVEEADELLMAMALHTLADDLAFQHIKRCEQRRDAMTLVVVCDGAGTSLLHRQPRLGAVQRLDLAFLIDRENDGVVGRVDVEADDLFELGRKLGIVGQLEPADPMPPGFGFSHRPLDRTQPGLPMKKGRAGTITHDYKRHGVTTLFAALDVLEGKVIGQCMKRHRHQEFIRFLNVIDAKVAKKKTVHVIVDNYAAHKHPKVLEWIENHPRFVFHFTPTSASWLNAVESFFAKLTKKRLKRGVFRSLQELKDAIHRFLDDTNANPKPFTWTKDPNKIIAAVKRGHQSLDSIH